VGEFPYQIVVGFAQVPRISSSTFMPFRARPDFDVPKKFDGLLFHARYEPEQKNTIIPTAIVSSNTVACIGGTVAFDL
jgi:hypothetical protein